MKILMINSVCGKGSTGRICTDIATELEKKGHEVKIAFGRDECPSQFNKFGIKISSSFKVKISGVKSRILDNHGFNDKSATRKFLKWADEFNPDVLHLHNIHGYYLNVEMLFNWIKTKPNLKVLWTLHDCWAFTGHCSHFDYVNCQKWKTKCYNCSQKGTYPKSLFLDNSKKNYLRKMKAFLGVKNLTIITPSNWLNNLVKQSFLNCYEVKTINNGIDLNVFKPTNSHFKKKFNLENKKVILGVANVWESRKGFDDFIKLSNLINDDFKIVLVGLNKKQIDILPKNIIGIEKTQSVVELAEIYSASDVFVNPTYEDNYPTVNLEAQACNTPVISYATGGSVESIPKNNVIPKGDVEKILEKLNEVLEVKQCDFSKTTMINDYLKIIEN